MLPVGTGCADVRSMRVWLREWCAAVGLWAASPGKANQEPFLKAETLCQKHRLLNVRSLSLMWFLLAVSSASFFPQLLGELSHTWALAATYCPLLVFSCPLSSSPFGQQGSSFLMLCWPKNLPCRLFFCTAVRLRKALEHVPRPSWTCTPCNTWGRGQCPR